jgi:hypothetical protein
MLAPIGRRCRALSSVHGPFFRSTRCPRKNPDISIPTTKHHPTFTEKRTWGSLPLVTFARNENVVTIARRFVVSFSDAACSAIDSCKVSVPSFRPRGRRRRRRSRGGCWTGRSFCSAGVSRIRTVRYNTMTASTLNLLRAIDESKVQTNLIPDVIPWLGNGCHMQTALF